jgi:alkanesulfonate monooxygenase SsuD/methylene tetrahydromethanopterin reductase-like flavin-dependent oxidoreductase (luciferase family)
MGALIDDKVLEAFAIVGTPDEIVPKLKARFGDAVDRVTLSMGYGAKADARELIAKLHG